MHKHVAHNKKPKLMRKGILILASILLINCSKKNIEKFEIEKYVDVKFEKVEYQGKMVEYSTPFIVEQTDSLGEIIKIHSRRFNYLLTNRINTDSLIKILPDTIKTRKAFNKEINSDQFYNNFEMLLFPNQKTKEKYSVEELMNIASKFFLAEKHGKKFGTRVCVGINGLDKIITKKDYTLLEAVTFDAIFDRIMQFDKPEPEFMSKQSEYLNNAIKKLDSVQEKTHLNLIREELYKSMKNDSDLKQQLLKFIEINKENIPFEITMGNTV